MMRTSKGRVALVAGSKACCVCGQCKPLADYHERKRSQDGHASDCKACRASKAQAHRAALRAARPVVVPVVPDGKVCSGCAAYKPLAAFSKGSGRYGCSSRCRECDSVVRTQSYHANRAAELASDLLRRKGNPERYAKRMRSAAARRRATLDKGYIVTQLTAGTRLRTEHIPDELIDLKRQQLELRRLAASMRRVLKQQKDKP